MFLAESCIHFGHLLPFFTSSITYVNICVLLCRFFGRYIHISFLLKHSNFDVCLDSCSNDVHVLRQHIFFFCAVNNRYIL